MALATTTPDSQSEDKNNPGQDEFDKLIDRNFSAGDEKMMEERAKDGAIDDATGKAAGSDELDKLGHGYTGDKGIEKIADIKPSVRGVVGFAKTNRGKIIIGGAVAGFVTLLIVGFFALLPFKILHMVSNIEKHFFASTENAVQKEESALFSQYLKKHVLPGLNTCKAGQKTTRYCTPKEIQGNSIVSKLYKGWKTARLENKIAEKYGLEFQKVGSNYFMTTPGLDGNGIKLDDKFVDPANPQSLDDYIKNKPDTGEFKKVSRNELRVAVNSALENETRYKQVLYRFKIGRLLEEKYGIKRCIVACKLRDNFADWTKNKKLAAKAFVIDRVITPRSASLGLMLQCLLAGASGGDSSSACPDTDPKKPAEPATTCDTGNCALNGEADSQWEKDLRGKWAAYRDKFGSTATKDLLAKVDDIRQNGYIKFLYNLSLKDPVDAAAAADQAKRPIGQDPAVFKGLDPNKPKDAAQIAKLQADFASKLGELGKTANLMGLLNTTANILDFVQKAPNALKKMSYITNAATMVSVWSMYRTYADEMKSGNIDATIVGSFTNTLSSGDQDPQNTKDQQVGGTASAEQAPLYSNLIGGQSSSNTVASLLGGTAYAAGAPNSTVCSGGPLISSKICPEESLTYNPVAKSFAAVVKTEPLKFLSDLAKQWVSIRNSFFGPIFKLVGSVFNATVGQLASFVLKVTGLGDVLQTVLDKLSQWLVKEVVPSPIGAKTSGGRTFDLMAGGAEVSANDYCHHGLGCPVAGPNLLASIQQEQQQLDQAKYQNQSFFAKMFDTSSDNSMVTKLAMALPNSSSQASSTLASFASNPFSKILGGFGTIFNPHPAYAAASTGSIFGDTPYAYSDKDIQAIGNQDDYWMAHCAVGDGSTPDIKLDKSTDPKSTYAWNKAAADPKTGLNKETFMPENVDPNPCLLIQAGVGSGGGLSDPSLLTKDETAEGTASTSTTDTTGGPGDISAYKNPFHDMSNLVANRIDEGVDYRAKPGTTVPVYAIGTGTVTKVARNDGTSDWWRSYGGNSVIYKLTNGPAAGDSVYVAEYCDVRPGISVNMTVYTTTALCDMTPSSIETGWGKGGSTDEPLASDVYVESHATAYGVNFSDLLVKLGAPSGTYDHPGETPLGIIPKGWPTW